MILPVDAGTVGLQNTGRENKERMNPQDLKDLKQLVEFLKENQIAEFDLDRGELKIRLKFQPIPQSLSDLSGLLAASAPAAHAAAPVVAAAAVPVQAAAAVDPDAGLHIVKSPIVGTFYGSPAPGSPPFVSIGERVEKGQVICIVEAMKLMNEIESDASGEIVKCYVSNGQPIEFGQSLFAIRQN